MDTPLFVFCTTRTHVNMIDDQLSESLVHPKEAVTVKPKVNRRTLESIAVKVVGL